MTDTERPGAHDRGSPLTAFLLAVAFAILGGWAGGCDDRSASPGPSRADAGGVTLYTSVDLTVAEPIVREFERETGLTVLIRGDTEATKTTGLVQRLRAERARPRADIFWSGEPVLTAALAREGILAPTPAPEGWPAELRGEEDRWVGFAPRCRVCVYNTGRVSPGDAPRSMFDLLDPRFAGRIVLARPAFGTTRGHIAALVAIWGEARARDWMRRLGAAGVRFVDGNSAVVRAVALGEADIGLTDTDDARAARRLGWPVEFTYIRHDAPDAEPPIRAGPLLIVNTVSLVAGGPRSEGARGLAEYLLSERVERVLAESEAGHFPVRPALAAEFAARNPPPPEPVLVDPQAIARAAPRAMELVREEWGQ